MKLKFVISFFILAFWVNELHAQQPEYSKGNNTFQRDFVRVNFYDNYPNSPTSGKPMVVNNLNEDKFQRFKKMRNGGIILTGVGTGLIITGVALIHADDYSDDYFDEDEILLNRAIGGVMCIATGVMSIGGGVTMWAIGNAKMKKYGSETVLLKSTKSGLALVYKF